MCLNTSVEIIYDMWNFNPRTVENHASNIAPLRRNRAYASAMFVYGEYTSRGQKL